MTMPDSADQARHGERDADEAAGCGRCWRHEGAPILQQHMSITGCCRTPGHLGDVLIEPCRVEIALLRAADSRDRVWAETK